MKISLRAAAVAALVLAGVAIAMQPAAAHKAITSKYTYNDDVFPILRDRCASCHVAGGVAPMSLMTYDEAFPWAESIRAELVASHMPPWNAEDGFGEFKHAHVLSPKELDVILTWATGGNPRGALDQKLPTVELKNDWKIGPPDLALKMPAEFTLAADKMEDTQEFTIAAGTTEARWVRAVDLLPGTPSIVRSATIFVKGANGARTGRGGSVARTRCSRCGSPGRISRRDRRRRVPAAGRRANRRADPLQEDVAVRGQGAERPQHGRHLFFEQRRHQERRNRSRRAGAAVAADRLGALQRRPALALDRTVTFSRTLSEDVQALGLSPDKVPGNISLQVEAVKPDGSRVPMIRLNTRADWDRRYWFEKPMTLPRGTRVEVTANLQDPDMLSAAFTSTPGTQAAPVRATAMRLTLNVVPARSKPTAP